MYINTVAQEFNFQHLNDGPSVTCYRVIQDRKGYIWISTENGLCRYDGRTYRWFNKEQSGGPIHSVFQLAEDSVGRILFNTVDSRIGYVYNDSVFFPPFNKKLQTFLQYGQIQILDMYVDKKGILWISTCLGLYRTISPNNYSDVECVEPPANTANCHIGITIIDNKALVFINNRSNKKKVEFNRLFYVFTNINGRVNIVLLYIAKSQIQPSYFKALLLNNGNILLSENTKLYTITQDGAISHSTFNNNIIYLYNDEVKGEWIGLWNEGLSYLSDLPNNFNTIESLKGQNVSSVIEDKESGIWATTLSGGVFYANTRYVMDYDNKDDLNGNIEAIYSLNGKILVNSGSNCLNSLKGDYIGRFSLPDSHLPIIVNDYYVKGNQIYVASTSGLFRMDSSMDGKCQKLNIKGKPTSTGVYRLSDATDGALYGIISYAITIINRDNIEILDTFSARGNCLCATDREGILFGCFNGLYSYKDGKNVYLGKGNEFLSSSINVIKENKSGDIWMGSSSDGIGLYREGKVTVHKTVQDGLASNLVHDIAFDSTGNIWVATDNGISKIIPSGNYSIENYDERNGLTSKEINAITIQGDYLWAGTKEGVCKIDIAHLAKNSVPPLVYITHVYVNDSLLINGKDFTHNNNNLRFSMVGLTYKDDKQRYLYRLIGLDSVWHETKLPEVPFNNLSPGAYLFEVKAVNADGFPSVKPATYKFDIESPYWLRWWFILLESLCGAMVVYLFIRYRLNEIKKKESEKTRINKMLAEYQMSALSAQMNPHFVFNAINSIQDYVLGNDTQKAYDYLTKFAQLVRIILYNAKERTITLEKEIESLRMYIELESLRFENKFEFVLEVKDEVDIYGIQVPSMIIQPYVENAIWHGLMPMEGIRRGVLKISIGQEGSALKITVEDNGIGREESKKISKSATHKSVGMEITQDRLKVLNSILESGDSEINIYDLYDNNTQPSGTRVEIKININTD